MKLFNKKGFTLVELLAVIVVLIIVIFIAINKVNESTKKAKNNAVKANAIAYIKAVNSFLSEDSISSERMESGFFDLETLDEYGVKVSGTKPTDVIVYIEKYKVTSACVNYGSKKVILSNNVYSEPTNGTCDDVSFVTLSNSQTFSYTGSVQSFTIPKTGLYKIEAWGAQGDEYGSSANQAGGKGSYVSGYIMLEKNDILYIYVGGKGSAFNGGGRKAHQYANGAGATDIRLIDGSWNDVSSLASRILVAGSGGGGHSQLGGHGGTLKGIDGWNGSYGSHGGKGGTQIAGGDRGTGGHTNGVAGSLGTGGSGTAYSSGGGGGYYGGGSSGVDSNEGGGGGGGSSYISGYLGCVAVSAVDSLTPRLDKNEVQCTEQSALQDVTCSYHYSNKVFMNPIMNAGNEEMPTHDGTSTMIGNTNDGFVKISY